MSDDSGHSGSPQDAELVELVRTGKVDAEIAVRLGISVEQARLRVERLLRDRGVATRVDLRELLRNPTADRRQPRLSLTPAMFLFLSVALLMGAFGGWWLRALAGDDDKASGLLAAADATSAPSPTADQPGTPNVPVMVDGQLMTPIGRPFDIPPARSRVDGNSLVLEFDAPVVARAPESPALWRIAEKRPDRALFSLDNGRRQLVILARGSTDDGFAYGTLDSFAIFSRTAPGPTVTLMARSVLGQTYYTLKVESGWLYVSEEPAE
jgi:hypothetical protein